MTGTGERVSWTMIHPRGQPMKMRSFLAVAAGVVVIVVVTTLMDVALHAAGVFPPMGQPLTEIGRAHV